MDLGGWWSQALRGAGGGWARLGWLWMVAWLAGTTALHAQTPTPQTVSWTAPASGTVLVVGPGSAKHEFVKFLARNHPGALEEHVAGVETVDHPTDAQLVALARAAFAHAAAKERPIVATHATVQPGTRRKM